MHKQNLQTLTGTTESPAPLCICSHFRLRWRRCFKNSEVGIFLTAPSQASVGISRGVWTGLFWVYLGNRTFALYRSFVTSVPSCCRKYVPYVNWTHDDSWHRCLKSVEWLLLTVLPLSPSISCSLSSAFSTCLFPAYQLPSLQRSLPDSAGIIFLFHQPDIRPSLLGLLLCDSWEDATLMGEVHLPGLTQQKQHWADI